MLPLGDNLATVESTLANCANAERIVIKKKLLERDMIASLSIQRVTRPNKQKYARYKWYISDKSERKNRQQGGLMQAVDESVQSSVIN